MHPRVESSPPDPVKKPKQQLPAAADDAHHRGGGLGATLHHHLSARPRPWLVVAILAVQLLLLLSARSIHPSSPAPPLDRRAAAAPDLPLTVASSPSLPGDRDNGSRAGAACENGRVYVYDLPALFNKDLVDGCDNLNPWSSRCDALSNDGFGQPAVDLAGIVPDDILPAWYATDQFASEIIFHRRMLSDPCRTNDPSSAAGFYIPFYGGLAVGKYLWSVDRNFTARDRDQHARMLLGWIQGREPWRRFQGKDHFIVLGRITWDFRRSGDGDWGGSFLHMPGVEKVTRLLIERNPWDDRDVGIPYPTGFHPRGASDLRAWRAFLLGRRRSSLFCFAGATRSRFKNDFRGILLDQCAKGSCRSLDCGGARCSNRTAETLALFLDSVFCLQPRGDSFTRRSTFDCMVAGAIPVFFWRRSAYMQYDWFLPRDAGRYSVFIDRIAVRNGSAEVGEVLRGLGEERVRRMRETVVEMIPRLVYGQPGAELGAGVEDAFDVALNGALRRFRAEREEDGGGKVAAAAAASVDGGDPRQRRDEGSEN